MACGLPNRRCCPAVTHMVATGAKQHSAFNKPPRRIWKRCSKPDVPSRKRSATSSSSPPDPWANIPHGIAASLSAACARSAANSSAPPAATGIIPTPSGPTASLLSRGIRAMCRVALSPTSWTTSASRGTISTSRNFETLMELLVYPAVFYVWRARCLQKAS